MRIGKLAKLAKLAETLDLSREKLAIAKLGVEVSNFNPMFSSASSWARVKLGMAKLAEWNLQILGILTFSIAHGYAVNITEGFRQCQVRK